MNFTWEIVSMSTKDETNTDGVILQNSVVSVQWKRIGTDTDGTSHNFLSSSYFSAENTAESDFVPFFSLTETDVIGWLEEKLGNGELQKIDDIITKRVEKKNSIVRTPPWA